RPDAAFVQRSEDRDWPGVQWFRRELEYFFAVATRHALFDVAVFEEDGVATRPELPPGFDCLHGLFTPKHVYPCHTGAMGFQGVEPWPKYESCFISEDTDFN